MNKIYFEGLWKRNYKSIIHNLILSLSSIIIVLISSSCDDEFNVIGSNVLPEQDVITSEYDTTINIHTYPIEGPKIIGRNSILSVLIEYNSSVLLGSFNDPNFGISKASFLSQIVPLVNIGDDTTLIDKTFESLTLYLQYDSLFGDYFQPIRINVYEIIDTSVFTSSHIYSDLSPDAYVNYNEVLGSSIFYPYDTLTAKIVITNQNYIDRIMSVSDFEEDMEFYTNFPGVYVTTDDFPTEGAILKFDLEHDSSRLELKYIDDTTHKTLQLAFYYPDYINIFEHDYSNTAFNTYLGDSTNMDSVIYLQSMAGVSSVISFKDLELLKDKLHSDSAITINKAELVLEPEENTIPFGYSTDMYYPKNLMLFTANNTNNEYLGLLSFNQLQVPYYGTYIGYNYLNGSYNKGANRYILNMTLYIQQYFNDEIDIDEFILTAGTISQNATSSGRVVLRSAYHSNPMKLKIYYSKF